MAGTEGRKEGVPEGQKEEGKMDTRVTRRLCVREGTN